MFRWGFIGSKGIAFSVAKEISKNKEFEISAVYSKTFNHALEFGQTFQAKAYKSFESFLVDAKFDAVYIAAPQSFHYYYAKRLLKCGIPVLCEKSLTMDYESAKELYEIAEKNNTYFVEAMWSWFNKTAYKVKDWISNNRIGKVNKLKADFSLPSSFIMGKKKTFNAAYGHSAIYDLGIYPITYAYRLFGMPKEIVATGKVKHGIDLNCKVNLIYESGLTCDLTMAINKLGPVSLKISGEKGKIKVPFMFHQSRKAVLKVDKRETYSDNELIGLYEREFIIVSEEIRQGLLISEYVKKDDTLNVLKIIEEIKKQLGVTYTPFDI